MSETKNEVSTERVTPNITLGEDGKYRWVYEFDMLKNPTILITTVKALLLSFGIVMAFMLGMQLIEGVMTTFDEYWNFYKWMLVLLGVLLVLAVISYLILAKIYGWKYMVLFTMDEEGVENRQMKAQFDKTQAIGWLTAAVGLASGKVGMAGTGMLAATRDRAVSVFDSVRKVKSVRRRHVIYVNHLLMHNQIYAEDADFEFVRNWIVTHCPKAKIRG
ncbi:MAG: hypothetical protein II882_10020 [Lachnospiraceae bacterium]|nr:hypothetical protein [Lachnospiraceae bacterium]